MRYFFRNHSVVTKEILLYMATAKDTHEANFTRLLIEKSSQFLELFPYPLQKQKNKNHMNNFSIEEMNERLDYHQKMADRFFNLYNADITSVTMVVVTHDDTIIAPVQSLKTKLVDGHLRQFLYEMSVFHINERQKWEIAIGTGADQTIGKK
jgi:hypothetical protein